MRLSPTLFRPVIKFGLNICPPSFKFTEYQTVFRIALKSSSNADIGSFWKDTKNSPILHYDTYRNMKDALKSFLSKQEDKLKAILYD